MRVWLWLLVALLPAVAATTIEDDPEDVQRWLQNPVHRQSLKDAWGGSDHPLFAVLKASNHTHLLREPGFNRCWYDALYAWTSLELQTLEMMDSTAKFPEGLLQFSFTHLGIWDECVSVKNVTTSNGTFNGQMCLVNFRIKKSPEANAVRKRQAMPFDFDGMNPIMLEMLVMKMGICLPSTCSANDVATMFQYLMNATTIPLVVDVSDRDCTVQDRDPLDASDWVAVGILTILGLVMVSNTVYDLVIPGDAKKRIFTAFSVVSNGKKLLAAPRADGDQTLSCVHGIRFLSMCWVMLGHRYGVNVSMANTNPLFSIKFYNEVLRVGISNATVSVDTFFFLSGLLVGYVIFKQSPDKRKLNLPLYYIHRYIRLTPALAMMTLLSATLLNRISNGPAWPLYWGSMRTNCRKNWWNTLLYVNNYVDPTRACITQGWYLMVDMQIYWFAPLVIIPMIRTPKWAAVLIPLFTILGLVASFLISLLYELPANALVATGDTAEDYTTLYYYPMYTRFVPYLIGLSLGYFFGNRFALGEKPRPMKFLCSVLSWVIVAALLLVPLFLGYEFVHEPLPSNVYSALYNSLHRPMWAAGIAGVVYLCSNGNGGGVNVFLSWDGFQVLGRFTYCMYLVHASVQLIAIGAAQTYNHLSDWEILSDFASDLVVSLLFAGMLSVTCESPFLVLEKELLGGSHTRRVVKKTDNATNAVASVPDQGSSENTNSTSEEKENKSLKGDVEKGP